MACREVLLGFVAEPNGTKRSRQAHAPAPLFVSR